MIRKLVALGAFVSVWTSAGAQDGATVTPSAAAQRQVIRVPIKGQIGAEVLASGIEGALRRAAKLGVSDVVFVIDSPGGRVADARAIASVLAEHNASFEYHAIVSSAISASVWILASCDTIHALPAAKAGGAVVFRQSRSTGSVEVDAKLNSVLCAEVVAAAEQKGHPAALFEAMMLAERELHAWSDADGAQRVSCSRSAAGPGARLLDTDETVLTLTAEQMVELGLADPLADEELSTLAGALGVEWRELPRIGEAELLRAANDLKRIDRERARVERRLKDARDGAVAAAQRIEQLRIRAEEATFRIPTYSPYTRLHAGGRGRGEAIDYAVSLWGDVISGLHAIDAQESAFASASRLLRLRLEAEHELRLYSRIEPFVPPDTDSLDHGVDKEGLYAQAAREQERLREMK
jgi:ATP-dependent protease ClpP protease subunit